MGVGKTIFGLEVLSKVRVEKRANLVISGSSAALREQWKENLELIDLAANVEVHTYQSWHKVKDRQWGVVIFDECHHLPAETFSRLSTIDAEYRIGLSATPYREDRRTDYIFALTGFPVGLDWRVLIELGLIKEPEITLFLSSTYRQKREKLAELVQEPEKTLIYCFSIDMGKSLSRDFGIPFVHGSTPVKDRLEVIKNSQITIISSAGREGLSIHDIERTISYNFLFGSRQEETQFFGRLLHGEAEGRHIVMMTDDEYEKYGKRLYGIQEKGFKIKVSRIGGRVPRLPRISSQRRERRPAPRVPTARPRPIRDDSPRVETSDFPLFDERDPFSKKMILRILSSEFAKNQGGLLIGDIRRVLDHSHIKYASYGKLKDFIRRLYQSREISGRREGKKRRYFIMEAQSE
jgi:hypothetical protein